MSDCENCSSWWNFYTRTNAPDKMYTHKKKDEALKMYRRILWEKNASVCSCVCVFVFVFILKSEMHCIKVFLLFLSFLLCVSQCRFRPPLNVLLAKCLDKQRTWWKHICDWILCDIWNVAVLSACRFLCCCCCCWFWFGENWFFKCHVWNGTPFAAKRPNIFFPTFSSHFNGQI